MALLHRLSSSLRICPLEETLRKAAPFAAALGVSRVTEITWLDRVGVPVCASVRPAAQPGSLCVNAGKGLTLRAFGSRLSLAPIAIPQMLVACEWLLSEPRDDPARGGRARLPGGAR